MSWMTRNRSQGKGQPLLAEHTVRRFNDLDFNQQEITVANSSYKNIGRVSGLGSVGTFIYIYYVG